MAHPLINVIKQPKDEVVAAYNCIEYCYEVNDYVILVGSKSYLLLQIDSSIALNETMDIFRQQFLFTNDVNDNGHNIAIGVDEFQQRDFIYNTLLTNYEVVKNFNVAKVGTDKLSITAKKNGAAYNSDFLSTSSDVQELTNTLGVDSEVRTTYKVIGCVEVFENNEWVTKEELVRDVYLTKEPDGSLRSELCWKLQGILKNLYRNNKPDLNSISPYINDNGSFNFRFSIVDFKSTTSQVGRSGYFAVGKTICAINGRHKLEDNSKGMQPYYKNITDGFVLPLNQIPTVLDLCCNNNGFMSVFVEDKNNEGWSVEVYGNVYYKDGNIEFAYRYGGFSGVGSDVVIIPIGPQQLDICNDFLNNGSVARYNYQAYIFSNTPEQNLFLDGDNGTFQNDILNMIASTGLVMTQTPNGYIGNGILLEEMQDGQPYSLQGSTILTHANSILFEKGKVYFLEAWINVEGFDCECIGNMFLDGNFGTFDGLNPLDFITVISGASAEIIVGYDDKSLMVSDLQSTSLSNNSIIVSGDNPIYLIGNSNYLLTAWVKVIGLDCLDCVTQNLFLDGDNGTFDNGSISGIVTFPFIFATIGPGVIGNGLELLDFYEAPIVNETMLFKGDSTISFLAGRSYSLSMDVKISNFDCSKIGNLFLDGDYGTFEANDYNISTSIVGAVLSQQPLGRLGGKCMLFENAAPLVVTVNSNLIIGDSDIYFLPGKTYELSGWINLQGNASASACLDPSGLSLGMKIVSSTSVGDVTLISTTDAVYNNSTCGSNPSWIQVKYRFLVNNLINVKVGIVVRYGPSFLQPALQEILFDDFRVIEVGAINDTIRFNVGLESPIGANGTESINTQLIISDDCSNLDTWVNVQTQIDVTNNFSGKVGLRTTGLSEILANQGEGSPTLMRVDNIKVSGQFDNTKLQMVANSFPSGTTQVVDRYLEFGLDCSELNKWVKLQTTITTGEFVAGNASVGLQVVGNASCLESEDVEIVIDSIELIDTQKQNLEFYIITSDGANDLSTLKIDCDKLGKWHKLVASYAPTVDTNEKILIRLRNRVECITAGSVRVDEVKVFCREDASAALTPLQTVNMLNTESECGCDESPCNEEFAYLNELGQFDFIHFDKINSKGTIVSKFEIEVCEDCDEDISTQGRKTISASSRDKFTINARVRKENKDQLDVFIGSIKIFHIVNQEYYPIRLLSKELDTFMSSKKYIDVDLDFEYKFENPTLIL